MILASLFVSYLRREHGLSDCRALEVGDACFGDQADLQPVDLHQRGDRRHGYDGADPDAVRSEACETGGSATMSGRAHSHSTATSGHERLELAMQRHVAVPGNETHRKQLPSMTFTTILGEQLVSRTLPQTLLLWLAAVIPYASPCIDTTIEPLLPGLLQRCRSGLSWVPAALPVLQLPIDPGASRQWRGLPYRLRGRASHP